MAAGNTGPRVMGIITGNIGDGMAAKKFLDKAEILAQDDLKTEDVQIPEWGDAWVRVRTLNASERDHFEAGVKLVQRNGKR